MKQSKWECADQQSLAQEWVGVREINNTTAKTLTPNEVNGIFWLEVEEIGRPSTFVVLSLQLIRLEEQINEVSS